MSVRLRLCMSLLALALAASGCSVSGLSFRIDTRFDWVAPDDGADDIRLPLTIEWEMEDFDGFFVLFFDRSPMGPNKTLLDLVPKDDACRRQDICPDLEWLTDRDIFVTDQTSIVIEELRDRSGRRSDRDPHEVTLVLLDREGRRSGESAFVRTFVLDRKDDR